MIWLRRDSCRSSCPESMFCWRRQESGQRGPWQTRENSVSISCLEGSANVDVDLIHTLIQDTSISASTNTAFLNSLRETQGQLMAKLEAIDAPYKVRKVCRNRLVKVIRYAENAL